MSKGTIVQGNTSGEFSEDLEAITNWQEIPMLGVCWFFDLFGLLGANRYFRTMHPLVPQISNPLPVNSEWLGSNKVGFVNTNPILTEVNGLDTLASSILKGGAMQTVSIVPANLVAGANEVATQAPLTTIAQLCFQHNLVLPDLSDCGFRQGNLTTWDGQNTNAMNPANASRRLAFQYELAHGTRVAAGVPLARPPYSARFQCKFRGYGAPISAAFADQTEDARLGFSPGAADSATNAYKLMNLGNGGIATDIGVGPQVDMALGAANLLTRMQWLVEIPSTVSPGDVMDITSIQMIISGANNAALVAALAADNGVQVSCMKYRFVSVPFDFAVNTGKQLLASANQAQPRPVPRQTFF